MKVLVFVTYCDYDLATTEDTGVLVPDDFDMYAARREWMETDGAWVPLTGRNQHGPWESKRHKLRPKIQFRDWLRQRYETVDVVDCDVW